MWWLWEALAAVIALLFAIEMLFKSHVGRRVVPLSAFGNAAKLVTSKIVLFDGDCVLCNTSAQWVHQRNCPGEPTSNPGVIRFAALQSPVGVATLECLPHLKGVDSVLFIEPLDSEAVAVMCKSRAALAVMQQCGPAWCALSWVASVVPPVVRDAVYDCVARNRHRWFGKRSDGKCKRPPRGFASRVVKDGDVE